jgi:anthranilate phosphoribosyltransferase
VVPTLSKRSRGIQLDGHHQLPMTIDPGDFGLQSDCDAELPLFMPGEEGLGPGDNLALVAASGDVTRAVLAGQSGPARNQALLTAALVLRAGALVPTIADGLHRASEALDSGAASAVLGSLCRAGKI